MRLFSLFLLLLGNLYGSGTVSTFKSHHHSIFIETGSYSGDGIQMALDAGFDRIYSIELSPVLYQECKQRFSGNPHVILLCGDSSVVLGEVLKEIDEPVTFWLDGHYSGSATALGNTHTPILDELALIASHPIKTHTVLIDDVRLFGTVEFDFIELDEILSCLRKINPDYTFSFRDGFIKNDILVAEWK